MKTQHQPKTLTPKEATFWSEKTAKQLKNNTDAIIFDEEVSFDTHWSYSYIMDYIWSHEKVRKRKL